MSRGAVSRLYVSSLACCLTLPAAGWGQTVEEYRQRVDELTRLWEQAKAAHDSALASLGRPDTVRVGLLTVVTTAGWSEIVAAAAQVAWDSLSAIIGSDTVLLAGAPPTDWRINLDPTDVVDIAEWRRGTVHDILGRVAGAMLSLCDGETRSWLYGSLPVRGILTAHTRGIYTDLALGQSLAERSCFAGDVTACGRALGVVEVIDPALVLYEPAERRNLVAQHSWTFRRRSAVRLKECLDDGSDAACLELLRSLPDRRELFPLSHLARLNLAQFAFELGGEGAYTRFLDTGASSIADRLSRASGVTIDSLLVAWHAAVLAARPEPTLVSARLAWTSILWFFLLAYLATRSSRWRLD